MNFVDRVVAAIGITLASPLLLVAAVAIRLSSRGPVLYRALRAGRNGVPFTMFKLRTMHVGLEDSSRITGASDPRIFPLGKVLRRTKLDELPQLLNVVRGDMALVGPRPEDISIVREYYDSQMRESLSVRPGITSPGSLRYFRDESSLPDQPEQVEAVYLKDLLPRKIATDLVFVRHRTWGYELSVLARTLLGIFAPEAVMRRVFGAREAWEAAEAESILAERGGFA